ncbi:MAG: Clp protease [Chloroflexi bacterium]|nr:Clp protease [Chloroflexota bacterium]
MRQDDFTDQAREILARSHQIFREYRHSQWDVEHIFMALLEDRDGISGELFKKIEIDVESIKFKLDMMLRKSPKVSFQTDQIYVAPRAALVLEMSKIEAERLNDDFIGVEHLLVSVIQTDDGEVSKVVKQSSITLEKIYHALHQVRGNKRVSEPNAENLYKSLEKFSVDLTKLASDGLLDPVVGRDVEIARVSQTLIRRTKNNPILVGGAGVGKTAIVEGLANRIVSGDVPDELKDRKLIALDMSSMLAGAKFRGEFEERLKSVIDEIKQAKGEIIVFIDEIHTMVGAGSAEGAIDASNMMKPSLARGELQCIGATTESEYRKYIEKDSALERRFQSVLVTEPDYSTAIEMIKALRPRYESHHKIQISDEAVEAAVRLSQRYVTERLLPDKAVDLIDEAASKIRIDSQSLPSDLKETQIDLQQLENEEDAAVQIRDYQKAAELKSKRLRLEEEFSNKKKELDLDLDEDMQVNQFHIGSLIATWTGIPVDRLLESEKEKLLKMEDRLHERVIGQSDAIRSVSEAFRRTRAGLGDPNRPVGSFIFLGPTGVGKTELARALTQYLFDDEQNMVRIDMSEYMEKHSVSRLIGSPPGYVGFDESGQLTEAIRKRPFRVILFDEIEKAHPDVLNVLLQIMDDGRLTDSHGRTVDFSNTLILMTSNLGVQEAGKENVGFIRDPDDNSKINSDIEDALKSTFRPEFLNRIDEIIIFDPLDTKQMRQIVDLMLVQVQNRLDEHKIKISLSNSAKKWICSKGFDKLYGARPLRRVIQTYIENVLSSKILSGEIGSGSDVKIDANKSGLIVS